MNVTALQGQLQLVAIVAFHLLDASRLNFRALGCVVDERTIEIGLLSFRFQFIIGERLDIFTIQKRPIFPSVRAVVDLNRFLACEFEFDPRLAASLHVQSERQFYLLSLALRRIHHSMVRAAARCESSSATTRRGVTSACVHLTGPSHGLESSPCL